MSTHYHPSAEFVIPFTSLETKSLSLIADKAQKASTSEQMITYAIESTTKQRVEKFAVEEIVCWTGFAISSATYKFLSGVKNFLWKSKKHQFLNSHKWPKTSSKVNLLVMQEASDALSKTADSDTVSTYQVSSVQLVTDKKLKAFNKA